MSTELDFPIGSWIVIKKDQKGHRWYSTQEYMVIDYDRNSFSELLLVLDRRLPKDYGSRILMSNVELSPRHRRNMKLNSLLLNSK